MKKFVFEYVMILLNSQNSLLLKNHQFLAKHFFIIHRCKAQFTFILAKIKSQKIKTISFPPFFVWILYKNVGKILSSPELDIKVFKMAHGATDFSF